MVVRVARESVVSESVDLMLRKKKKREWNDDEKNWDSIVWSLDLMIFSGGYKKYNLWRKQQQHQYVVL